MVALFAVVEHAAAPDPSALSLLAQKDLHYVGAFRLPEGRFGGSDFPFGGTAMAFNPANHSLFIVGRYQDQMTAEITVPAAVTSDALDALPIAKVLQPFFDDTEGKRNTVHDPGTFNALGGHLVFGGMLYGTAYSTYDADYTQKVSHYRRSLTLQTSGVLGMLRVKNDGDNAGFVSGYMAVVPEVWQPLLGGPAITGQCCIGIVTRTSNGPSAFVFNPADLGRKDPVPTSPLVFYPSDSPLASWDSQNEYYNGTTHIAGVVLPVGTRTLLFFGSHGIGSWCYGVGGPDGKCKDPVSSSTGTHAYPYTHQIWAYDVNELKRGKRAPWKAKPYGLWRFDIPFQNGRRVPAGVAYDPATSRIFLSELTNRGETVIHVFEVSCQLCPHGAS